MEVISIDGLKLTYPRGREDERNNLLIKTLEELKLSRDRIREDITQLNMESVADPFFDPSEQINENEMRLKRFQSQISIISTMIRAINGENLSETPSLEQIPMIQVINEEVKIDSQIDFDEKF